jgi:hypothetical protein
MVPDDDPVVSSEDSGGCPVAAADPGGAELCSFAPLEVSPLASVEDLCDRSLSAGEPGGAELCSFAPLEVSLPAAFSPAGWLDGSTPDSSLRNTPMNCELTFGGAVFVKEQIDAHHFMAVRRADRRHRSAIPFTRDLTTTLTIEVSG